MFLYLLDPETCEEVYISKCGNGLTEVEVKELADPDLYPMVWSVEFSAWTKKGSLEFSTFLRTRPDKSCDECTMGQIEREE